MINKIIKYSKSIGLDLSEDDLIRLEKLGESGKNVKWILVNMKQGIPLVDVLVKYMCFTKGV